MKDSQQMDGIEGFGFLDNENNQKFLVTLTTKS